MSDSSDEILRLQGVGWTTRTAIYYASIYLSVNHYTDDGGIEHIDIDQTLTGGIGGTTENRALDWLERSHEDHIFGAVLGKNRRAPLAELEREWLKKDWLDESLVDGAIIYTQANSDTPKSGKTWASQQVSVSSLVTCCS